MNKGLRISWVVSHPIQYYVPLYKRLSHSKYFGFEVLYLSERGSKPYFDHEFSKTLQFDTELLKGYNFKFLRNLSQIKRSLNFFAHVNPGIVIHILKRSDIVVFHSWNSFSSVLGIVTCLLARKDFYIRSDSNALGLKSELSFHKRLKRVLKRLLIEPLLRRCTGVLSIGKRNEEYFTLIGIDSKKFFHVPFSVDTEFFSRFRWVKKALKVDFCQNRGLESERMIFLFVGKILKSKGVFDLLEQAKCFPQAIFIFVGDGPDLSSLKAAASDCLNVVFLGFQNQSELPILYGMSDFVILPSHHEAWGLSINEGIAAGCVPIVSHVCGCAPELVETTSKLIFQSQNVKTFSDVLNVALQIDDFSEILQKIDRINFLNSIEASSKNFEKVIFRLVQDSF